MERRRIELDGMLVAGLLGVLLGCASGGKVSPSAAWDSTPRFTSSVSGSDPHATIKLQKNLFGDFGLLLNGKRLDDGKLTEGLKVAPGAYKLSVRRGKDGEQRNFDLNLTCSWYPARP